MKLPAIFITLLLSTFCVLSADKNELKVKINHVYSIGSAGDDNRFSRRGKPTIQFNYDTKEILQITNEPENFRNGMFLTRDEVKKFKSLLDKMIKFGDAIHQNKITGVKKKFEDKTLWTKGMYAAPNLDIEEDGDPSDKTDISGHVYFYTTPDSRRGTNYYSQRWNYAQLLELQKIFDEKQKEVFKKYDLLKALND